MTRMFPAEIHSPQFFKKCENGCWRQSLKEILIIRFEINGIIGIGVAF